MFINKIKDKDTIELYKGANFKTLILHYVQSLPLPVKPKEYNNQFVWIKMVADHVLQVERDESKRLNKAKDNYKKFIRENKIKNLKDLTDEQYKAYLSLVDLIDSSQNLLELYQKQIMAIDYRLEYICNYYDKIDLPLDEFVGLCGLNMVNAKLSIRNEDVEKEHKHWTYLFNGIEDSHEEEGWKSNRNGMPLFHLTLENFLLVMDRNKDLKAKMDGFIMNDMGMATGAMTLTEDEEGNMVLSKYYPPLREVSKK
jgi:hypothetical protein